MVGKKDGRNKERERERNFGVVERWGGRREKIPRVYVCVCDARQKGFFGGSIKVVVMVEIVGE